ncbi:hypothetical protein ACPA54_29305 [Uniformispora flossi]|uniref:hypothetical protein n=1 Tax=Uniformispora flossi TaxID=3390723 RepID=UPI003C2D815E
MPDCLTGSAATRRADQVFADRLGLPLIDMPGSHVWAISEPAEFARALEPLLEPSVT